MYLNGEWPDDSSKTIKPIEKKTNAVEYMWRFLDCESRTACIENNSENTIKKIARKAEELFRKISLVSEKGAVPERQYMRNENAL